MGNNSAADGGRGLCIGIGQRSGWPCAIRWQAEPHVCTNRASAKEPNESSVSRISFKSRAQSSTFGVIDGGAERQFRVTGLH